MVQFQLISTSINGVFQMDMGIPITKKKSADAKIILVIELGLEICKKMSG